MPEGRRARLLLAGLVAVGTAVPLILAAPGGPGTSFLRVAAPLPEAPTTTTTSTTLRPSVTPATTIPAKPAQTTSHPTTTLRPVTPPTGLSRPAASSPHTTPTNPPATTVVTPPPGPAAGVVTWCSTAQLGLSVATSQASYLPGDTMQINIDAVNRSNTACVLGDPTGANAPANTCQPDTLVEAPYNPAIGGLPVVADVGPACSGGAHLLAAGDAWRTSLTVAIPSDGSWTPGIYAVHSEWQAPGQLVSADTSFTLGGSTTTTTTPSNTSIP